MLKKIKITNFLSCQNTEIEFDNITALIGRNATGKSNILKAIEWCAQFAVGNKSLIAHFDLTGVFTTECSIEFLIDNQCFKYDISITSSHTEDKLLIENLFVHTNGEWELIAKRNNDIGTLYGEENINFNINFQSPMIGSITSLLPKKRLNLFIDKVSDYLSRIKYYTLDDYNHKYISGNSYFSYINDHDYRQWLSKKNKSDSSIVMKLLHIWHKDKELFEKLNEIIGKNCLNLIDTIEISKVNLGQSDEIMLLDYIYIIKFHIMNSAVYYTQLSYGTHRVLAILLALLYDKNRVLLIEQPEDGIHSGLLKKLLPMCFQYAEYYNKQLIIATQSAEVINLFQPENIRLVKITENGSKVSPLDKERLPYIRNYIENEGVLFDLIETMDNE